MLRLLRWNTSMTLSARIWYVFLCTALNTLAENPLPRLPIFTRSWGFKATLGWSTLVQVFSRGVCAVLLEMVRMPLRSMTKRPLQNSPLVILHDALTDVSSTSLEASRSVTLKSIESLASFDLRESLPIGGLSQSIVSCGRSPTDWNEALLSLLLRWLSFRRSLLRPLECTGKSSASVSPSTLASVLAMSKSSFTPRRFRLLALAVSPLVSGVFPLAAASKARPGAGTSLLGVCCEMLSFSPGPFFSLDLADLGVLNFLGVLPPICSFTAGLHLRSDELEFCFGETS
mmetsp:Transcript_13437/g.24324  ORF Transcript_13437/g.24324 Transcript_13437/m.24324 type:complete len:287 (+) Transcript_13437:1267-2127(+)